VPLVVGVDSSTQSTKVEVRDIDSGTLLGTGRAPHPATTPPRSEQDPGAWWAALQTATGEAVRAARAHGPAPVVGASVAGQQHGMVALDRAGEVIRPAKLWNDTESAADADWLIDRLGGPQQWADACGSVPVASFTITKLSWLHRNEPRSWDRLAKILLPHDWLTYRLTGRYVTDRGDASGTGYWSPFDDAWLPALLRVVEDRTADDWRHCLPEVLGRAEPAGTLSPEAARHVGLDGAAVVGPGTGDNMAAALGIALGTGDVAVSIGTSGTVYTVAERPTSDASGAVAGFADASGRFLPLVCTLNATQVTDAVARLLGVDHHELDRLALDCPAGAEGLTLLPYFAGERTPNRPAATGLLAGLRTDVSRRALARAAFEGVVCGLLDGLDALRAAGVPTDGSRLVMVGGGARSAAYRQVLADLSGRPVLVPEGDEQVATGACVQAAATVTGADPVQVATTWGLGTGTLTEPAHGVDRDGVRQRYAVARGI
jgi:xylulokinase